MRRSVALVLCAAGLLLGQDKKWHTAIHIDVDASMPALKDAIVSYITREIRSLGDVGVDDGALLTLHITAITLENKGGLKTGVVLSSILTRKTTATALDSFVRGTLVKPTVDLLKLEYADKEVFEFTALYVNGTSKDNVEELCARIVADIDIREFQPMRRDFRTLMRRNEK